MISPTSPLDALLTEVRNCRMCEAHLPMGPRPILQAAPTARILIVGQAPGLSVHQSGIPWNDASGERLRSWIGMDRETFYDASHIAIIPMGYCYPGRAASGDKPPRRECAELWLDALLAELPHIQTTLLLGQYAQRHFLADRCKSTLADTVRCWQDHAPEYFPLPHPSPRNTAWFQRHPWLETDLLPALLQRIQELLST